MSNSESKTTDDPHFIFDEPDDGGRKGPDKMRIHSPECGWCKEGADMIDQLRAEVARLQAVVRSMGGSV